MCGAALKPLPGPVGITGPGRGSPCPPHSLSPTGGKAAGRYRPRRVRPTCRGTPRPRPLGQEAGRGLEVPGRSGLRCPPRGAPWAARAVRRARCFPRGLARPFSHGEEGKAGEEREGGREDRREDGEEGVPQSQEGGGEWRIWGGSGSPGPRGLGLPWGVAALLRCEAISACVRGHSEKGIKGEMKLLSGRLLPYR